MKIFGREPAFYVGLVELVLALLLSINGFGLNQEQVAAIMAVVTLGLGVYTAWATKETLLGVGVGLAKSIIILFAAFGLALDENTTVAIIGLVAFLLGAFNRTQAHPLVKGNFDLAT